MDDLYPSVHPTVPHLPPPSKDARGVGNLQGGGGGSGGGGTSSTRTSSFGVHPGTSAARGVSFSLNPCTQSSLSPPPLLSISSSAGAAPPAYPSSQSRVYFPQASLSSVAHRLTRDGILYSALVTGGRVTGYSRAQSSTLTTTTSSSSSSSSSSFPICRPPASMIQLQPSSRVVLFEDGLRMAESPPFSLFFPHWWRLGQRSPEEANKGTCGPSVANTPRRGGGGPPPPRPGLSLLSVPSSPLLSGIREPSSRTGESGAEQSSWLQPRHCGVPSSSSTVASSVASFSPLSPLGPTSSWTTRKEDQEDRDEQRTPCIREGRGGRLEHLLHTVAPHPFTEEKGHETTPSSSFFGWKEQVWDEFPEALCVISPYRRCVPPTTTTTIPHKKRTRLPCSGAAFEIDEEEGEEGVAIAVGINEGGNGKGFGGAPRAARLLVFLYSPFATLSSSAGWGPPRGGAARVVEDSSLPRTSLYGGIVIGAVEHQRRRTEAKKDAVAALPRAIRQMAFAPSSRWLCILYTDGVEVLDLTLFSLLQRETAWGMEQRGMGSSSTTRGAISPATIPIVVPVLWQRDGFYQRFTICPHPFTPHIALVSASGGEVSIFPHASVLQGTLSECLHWWKSHEPQRGHEGGGRLFQPHTGGVVEGEGGEEEEERSEGWDVNTALEQAFQYAEDRKQEGGDPFFSPTSPVRGSGAGWPSSSASSSFLAPGTTTSSSSRIGPTMGVTRGKVYASTPIQLSIGLQYKAHDLMWRHTATRVLLCVVISHAGPSPSIRTGGREPSWSSSSSSTVPTRLLSIYEWKVTSDTVFFTNVHRLAVCDTLTARSRCSDAGGGGTPCHRDGEGQEEVPNLASRFASPSSPRGTPGTLAEPGPCWCPCTTCQGLLASKGSERFLSLPCTRMGNGMGARAEKKENGGGGSGTTSARFFSEGKREEEYPHVQVHWLGMVPLQPTTIPTTSSSAAFPVDSLASRRTTEKDDVPTSRRREDGKAMEEEEEAGWIGWSGASYDTTPFPLASSLLLPRPLPMDAACERPTAASPSPPLTALETQNDAPDEDATAGGSKKNGPAAAADASNMRGERASNTRSEATDRSLRLPQMEWTTFVSPFLASIEEEEVERRVLPAPPRRRPPRASREGPRSGTLVDHDEEERSIGEEENRPSHHCHHDQGNSEEGAEDPGLVVFLKRTERGIGEVPMTGLQLLHLNHLTGGLGWTRVAVGHTPEGRSENEAMRWMGGRPHLVHHHGILSVMGTTPPPPSSLFTPLPLPSTTTTTTTPSTSNKEPFEVQDGTPVANPMAPPSPSSSFPLLPFCTSPVPLTHLLWYWGAVCEVTVLPYFSSPPLAGMRAPPSWTEWASLSLGKTRRPFPEGVRSPCDVEEEEQTNEGRRRPSGTEAMGSPSSSLPTTTTTAEKGKGEGRPAHRSPTLHAVLTFASGTVARVQLFEGEVHLCEGGQKSSNCITRVTMALVHSYFTTGEAPLVQLVPVEHASPESQLAAPEKKKRGGGGGGGEDEDEEEGTLVLGLQREDRGGMYCSFRAAAASLSSTTTTMLERREHAFLSRHEEGTCHTCPPSPRYPRSVFADSPVRWGIAMFRHVFLSPPRSALQAPARSWRQACDGGTTASSVAVGATLDHSGGHRQTSRSVFLVEEERDTEGPVLGVSLEGLIPLSILQPDGEDEEEERNPLKGHDTHTKSQAWMDAVKILGTMRTLMGVVVALSVHVSSSWSVGSPSWEEDRRVTHLLWLPPPRPGGGSRNSLSSFSATPSFTYPSSSSSSSSFVDGLLGSSAEAVRKGLGRMARVGHPEGSAYEFSTSFVAALSFSASLSSSAISLVGKPFYYFGLLLPMQAVWEGLRMEGGTTSTITCGTSEDPLQTTPYLTSSTTHDRHTISCGRGISVEPKEERRERSQKDKDPSMREEEEKGRREGVEPHRKPEKRNPLTTASSFPWHSSRGPLASLFRTRIPLEPSTTVSRAPSWLWTRAGLDVLQDIFLYLDALEHHYSSSHWCPAFSSRAPPAPPEPGRGEKKNPPDVPDAASGGTSTRASEGSASASGMETLTREAGGKQASPSCMARTRERMDFLLQRWVLTNDSLEWEKGKQGPCGSGDSAGHIPIYWYVSPSAGSSTTSASSSSPISFPVLHLQSPLLPIPTTTTASISLFPCHSSARDLAAALGPFFRVRDVQVKTLVDFTLVVGVLVDRPTSIRTSRVIEADVSSSSSSMLTPEKKEGLPPPPGSHFSSEMTHPFFSTSQVPLEKSRDDASSEQVPRENRTVVVTYEVELWIYSCPPVSPFLHSPPSCSSPLVSSSSPSTFSGTHPDGDGDQKEEDNDDSGGEASTSSLFQRDAILPCGSYTRYVPVSSFVSSSSVPHAKEDMETTVPVEHTSEASHGPNAPPSFWFSLGTRGEVWVMQPGPPPSSSASWSMPSSFSSFPFTAGTPGLGCWVRCMAPGPRGFIEPSPSSLEKRDEEECTHMTPSPRVQGQWIPFYVFHHFYPFPWSVYHGEEEEEEEVMMRGTPVPSSIPTRMGFSMTREERRRGIGGGGGSSRGKGGEGEAMRWKRRSSNEVSLSLPPGLLAGLGVGAAGGSGASLPSASSSLSLFRKEGERGGGVNGKGMSLSLPFASTTMLPPPPHHH